jgi:hypothetical protein
VRRIIVAVAVVAVVAAFAVYWTADGSRAGAQGPVTKDEIGDSVQTVTRGGLPQFAADADTPALYRFATTRGDVLRYMPCTCGCAGFGHTSNRSCYIKAETEASVTYTSHAAT